MLPAKARRIVGIVLLSVGIFLGIIGLLLMKLFEGADSGLGGIGELIWLILLGLGIISICLLYTSPSPRDATLSRMPSSA